MNEQTYQQLKKKRKKKEKRKIEKEKWRKGIAKVYFKIIILVIM